MTNNKMFKATTMIIALAAMAQLTGCASIVSGTSQVVSVETIARTGPVAGANCKLENDKGVYFVTTPGTVTVHRAYGDMTIKCEKEKVPTGIAVFKSSTKAMMAGNILFGGFIGAGVDAASGAAYDYPSLMQIMMGETTGLQMPAVAVPLAEAPVSSAAVAK